MWPFAASGYAARKRALSDWYLCNDEGEPEPNTVRTNRAMPWWCAKVRRGHSCVKELEGNEGPLVVLGSEQLVAALSPIGRPIPERGMKPKRWIALRPVFDDVLPQLALRTTAPIGVAHGDIRYDKPCCGNGVRRQGLTVTSMVATSGACTSHGGIWVFSSGVALTQTCVARVSN